jgi:hypothetical protein
MEDFSQFEALKACDPADAGETGETVPDLGSTAFTLHQFEHSVQRELLAQPGLRFSSLVVRRIPKGVCLEGVLEAAVAPDDVTSLAQRVAGVEQVLNHLVIRRPLRKG